MAQECCVFFSGESTTFTQEVTERAVSYRSTGASIASDSTEHGVAFRGPSLRENRERKRPGERGSGLSDVSDFIRWEADMGERPGPGKSR